MKQIMLYRIPYKSLKIGSHGFDFQVDDALFEAYDREEIKGGRCNVHIALDRAETMLELHVTISGEVICECDRCLEDCVVPVEYEGDLVVKFSDEVNDYDGEVMWISPAEDSIDLMQYIYESIVLSLPYRRVHPEGECNPEMLASFTTVSEEEFERIAAEVENADTASLDQSSREALEELKRRMEQTE